MTGRLIFLTMTALPESDAATSFGLERLVAVEQAANGVGDRAAVDDRAVDDGCRAAPARRRMATTR